MRCTVARTEDGEGGADARGRRERIEVWYDSAQDAVRGGAAHVVVVPHHDYLIARERHL